MILSILSKNSENKKFYDKVLTKDLNFTDDSISNSNSLYNSQFNFPDVIQNVVKKEPTLNTNKMKLRKSKTLNLLKIDNNLVFFTEFFVMIDLI